MIGNAPRTDGRDLTQASPHGRADGDGTHPNGCDADHSSPRPADLLLERVGTLPSLPPVLLRVADMMQNPATSASQLAHIILEDQALTARLLQLVNSPFYGFPRKIATVTETLTILGFRPVQHLLLTASIVDLLRADDIPGFSAIGLWQHAVGTAVASRLLARAAGHDAQEELFVAGLLHDVGKLLHLRCIRDEFIEALALAQAEDIPLHVAEKRLLGFDHSETGRVLLDSWALPSRLCEAVACHHHLSMARDAQWESAIVHAADIVAHVLGLGESGEDAVPCPHEAAWEWVGVPSHMIESLFSEIDEQHHDLLGMLLSTMRAFPGLDESLRGAAWTPHGLHIGRS